MKLAIVTGASDGLGLEISKVFLEKGVKVVGISRTKPKIEIDWIKADLTKEKDIELAIKQIKEKFPKFDCLINCAGVMSLEALGKINYLAVENVFKVNVLAPIMLVSGLIENIKENNADVVNIGSTVGLKAYEEQCAYGASKWAIRGVTEYLQLELKNTKCRVIGFNPGGFKSKIFEKASGIKKDMSPYMEPKELAKFLVQILELPKNMEVSQIVVNRK